MKRKYVPVRMRNEVLERVKKEALTRGLSIPGADPRMFLIAVSI